MSFFKRLWNDEDGFIVSLELILVALMLVFGLIVGFQVLRDAMDEELGDLAMAIGAINQSYQITGVQAPTMNGGFFSYVEGSLFGDAIDMNDDGSAPAPNAVPASLTLGNVGLPE